MLLDQIMNLKESDGLTLKNYTSITYKTGWQVADCGVECRTAAEVAQAVHSYKGTCGIWYEKGVWYIDHSFRVKTKREALRIGKEHNQISVLKWSNMSLVYC